MLFDPNEANSNMARNLWPLSECTSYINRTMCSHLVDLLSHDTLHVRDAAAQAIASAVSILIEKSTVEGDMETNDGNFVLTNLMDLFLTAGGSQPESKYVPFCVQVSYIYFLQRPIIEVLRR